MINHDRSPASPAPPENFSRALPPQINSPGVQHFVSNQGLVAGLATVVAFVALAIYITLTDGTLRDRLANALMTAGSAPSTSVSAAKTIRSVDVASAQEIAVLRGRLAALTQTVLMLQHANADLAARDRAVSLKLAAAEKSRASTVAAAKHLGGRMTARVRFGAARLIATLPGKVVPAIGATIAVGSTVLELQDLCESIRDVAVLNQTVGLPAVDDQSVCGIRIGSVQAVVTDAQRNFKETYVKARQAIGLAVPAPGVSTRGRPGQ